MKLEQFNTKLTGLRGYYKISDLYELYNGLKLELDPGYEAEDLLFMMRDMDGGEPLTDDQLMEDLEALVCIKFEDFIGAKMIQLRYVTEVYDRSFIAMIREGKEFYVDCTV